MMSSCRFPPRSSSKLQVTSGHGYGFTARGRRRRPTAPAWAHCTADEKITYTLENLRALTMGGCVVYAGEGSSAGVLHMLQSPEVAADCLPDPTDLASRQRTRELDHVLAMHFRWWDILVQGTRPFSL